MYHLVFGNNLLIHFVSVVLSAICWFTYFHTSTDFIIFILTTLIPSLKNYFT